jgi:hypothetical protein
MLDMGIIKVHGSSHDPKRSYSMVFRASSEQVQSYWLVLLFQVFGFTVNTLTINVLWINLELQSKFKLALP